MRKSIIVETVQILLLAALVFLGMRATFDNFVVKGSSMEHSLTDGEYLVINKAVYLRSTWLSRLNPFGNGGDRNYVFHPPQRGDIIVFQPPHPSLFPYIKRVIAVPGDTIEVRQGQVLLNGHVLSEPYIAEAMRTDRAFPRQVVPAGHVFVLGDNRNYSEDSTYFGMLPVDNIVGKAWATYWPPRVWGPVPNFSLAGDGTH